MKIARAIFSIITSNIKNAEGEGQVVLAGGVSYNFVLENIPYTMDGTSIAIVMDINLDVDEGSIKVNNTSFEKDTVSRFSLTDESESAIVFNDSRRIRWRRRVFCEDNKEVVIKERIVGMAEATDDGFTFTRRVYITVHISATDRCRRLVWDPAAEIPSDEIEAPPEATDTAVITSSGSSNNNGNTANGSEKLLFTISSLLIVLLYLLF